MPDSYEVLVVDSDDDVKALFTAGFKDEDIVMPMDIERTKELIANLEAAASTEPELVVFVIRKERVVESGE